MDELVAFLAARLDEDEQVALSVYEPFRVWQFGEFAESVAVVGVNHYVACGPYEGVVDEHEGAHIARWDPTRVLREVAATRALIQTYEEACRFYADEPDLCVAGEVEGLRTGLKLRAGVYSDHPGFREEWRP